MEGEAYVCKCETKKAQNEHVTKGGREGRRGGRI